MQEPIFIILGASSVRVSGFHRHFSIENFGIATSGPQFELVCKYVAEACCTTLLDVLNRLFAFYPSCPKLFHVLYNLTLIQTPFREIHLSLDLPLYTAFSRNKLTGDFANDGKHKS